MTYSFPVYSREFGDHEINGNWSNDNTIGISIDTAGKHDSIEQHRYIALTPEMWRPILDAFQTADDGLFYTTQDTQTSFGIWTFDYTYQAIKTGEDLTVTRSFTNHAGTVFTNTVSCPYSCFVEVFKAGCAKRDSYLPNGITSAFGLQSTDVATNADGL